MPLAGVMGQERADLNPVSPVSLMNIRQCSRVRQDEVSNKVFWVYLVVIKGFLFKKRPYFTIVVPGESAWFTRFSKEKAMHNSGL
jgi:hypothetical protein